MSVATPEPGQPTTIHWSPHLIKQLRGKRTQAAFGALLGVSKNTIWRWEIGRSCPTALYEARLAALATDECFLTDWELVGSITLCGDLESAKADLALLCRAALERTARHLTE